MGWQGTYEGEAKQPVAQNRAWEHRGGGNLDQRLAGCDRDAVLVERHRRAYIMFNSQDPGTQIRSARHLDPRLGGKDNHRDSVQLWPYRLWPGPGRDGVVPCIIVCICRHTWKQCLTMQARSRSERAVVARLSNKKKKKDILQRRNFQVTGEQKSKTIGSVASRDSVAREAV